MYRHAARAAVSAATFLMVACGQEAGSRLPHGPPPVSVELETVKREDISDVLDLVGQLEAEESVLLKPETEGVVESVEFQEGQEIEKGKLLFQLRDEEERAKLQEAEAQLSLAEDEYRRAKTLAAKSTVSQSELDGATAEWEAAKARRDLAQVERQRMEIRAPFDGVLGARLVSPGDHVEKRTGLVQIDSVARLRLAFTIPEVAVPLARVGAPVNVSVAPWPGEKFPGEVYFVAPSLDPRNRRLLLKGWVPNPERKLRPGMFATIRVEIAHHDDALVVPESAITYDADGAFVWRIDGDNTAQRAPVEMGIRRPGRVEIVSGIEAGDAIVSAGTHKVVAGAKVEKVDPVPVRLEESEGGFATGASGDSR